MAVVGFPPAWLHNEFLEKILTSSPSDSKLVVTRSEQDRPEEAVDGTLTVLFRVVVHMERSNEPRDRSLIVKTIVQNLEFFRKCKIFEREARMYTYMLPAVHKVLLEFSSDLIPSFSPKCIYTELENPAPCIIMEDITVEGFKTMSKDDAQNINICKNVARAMAKYHVGTIGPCERAPQMLEVLAEDVYNAELRAKLEPLYRGVLKCVAREVESWPVYGDKFAGGLRRLADNVMDIIANSARASVEGMQVLSCSDLLEERREKQNCYELKVLTHGDLIMTNIMLKSSNGSPDVRRRIKMPAETLKDIPDWLNKRFLETALRSGECDRNITVTSMEFARATANGDNYLSIMYRANLKIIRENNRRSGEEEISLVIKCTPLEVNVRKIATELGIFERETQVFIVVLPEMFRLLDEASPGSFQPFGAKCVYHELLPETCVIVLEDLKKQGFTMAQRHAGLDLEHSLLVIRTLARFHAASVALHQRDPGYVKPFDQRAGADNEEQRNSLDDLFSCVLKNLADEVEEMPDFKDLYPEKLRKLANNIRNKIYDVSERKDDEFNVLTHGDIWVNNVMFQYDESTKKLKDLRFVDFQLSHWTSPAIDLHYFLFTSPNLDLWDKHDFFIEEYHKTLGDTLKLFDLEHLHPSLEELHRQLEDRSFYIIFSTVVILPIILTDPDQPMKLNEILEQSEVSKQNLQFSDAYRSAIRKFLPIFDAKGLL